MPSDLLATIREHIERQRERYRDMEVEADE